MKPAKVELHIEQLILHGFAPGDRYRIADALERELASLLGTGVPWSLTHSLDVERLDSGAFHTAPGAPGETIGGQVAQAVYRGLKR
jgi:hypothetical protein